MSAPQVVAIDGAALVAQLTALQRQAQAIEQQAAALIAQLVPREALPVAESVGEDGALQTSAIVKDDPLRPAVFMQHREQQQ